MIRVEVIGAYVDDHGPGSIVEVDEKTANYLERIGYGKILEVEEPKEPKVEPEVKPKRKPRKKKED